MSIMRNLILAAALLGLAATASAAGRDRTPDQMQSHDWTGKYIKGDQTSDGDWTDIHNDEGE